MKKLSLILSFAFILCSCKYSAGNIFYSGNNVINRDTKITEVAAPSGYTGQKSYTVLFYTDKHTGSDRASNKDDLLFAWLDELKGTEDFPLFVIDGGDSVDTGRESEYEEYGRFCRKLKDEYNLEVFAVPGNHDIYNEGWKYWHDYSSTGTAFYSFRTDAFSWYFFDTASGCVGLPQMNSLMDAVTKDPGPKIVITHYPLVAQNLVFCLQDTTERNLLVDCFARNNVKGVFSGHIHMSTEINLGKYTAFTLPSFLYDSSWGLLRINEEGGTFEIKTIKR